MVVTLKETNHFLAGQLILKPIRICDKLLKARLYRYQLYVQKLTYDIKIV